MVPPLSTTWLTPGQDRPLLVLGPSLGTSAAELWGPCADALGSSFGVLAWDLPGHAGGAVGGRFELVELAAAVVTAVEKAAPGRARFAYAGDSVGGAVGLCLLLQVPERVVAAVLVSTGARIGQPSAWLDRARTVRAHGTDAVVDGSLARWFGSHVVTTRPDLPDSFARTLRTVDREGYAQVCEALARFDVTDRLGEIEVPVLAVAGAQDLPTPVSSLIEIATKVRDGRLVVLEGVAHLPPVEAPEVVAGLLREHLAPADVA